MAAGVAVPFIAGADYEGAVPVVRILMAALGLMALASPLTAMLIASHRQAALALLTAACATAVLAADLAAAPVWGASGVAAIRAAGALAMLAGQAWLVAGTPWLQMWRRSKPIPRPVPAEPRL
jgi:O-antigen/teichoic acid export membrane protein